MRSKRRLTVDLEEYIEGKGCLTIPHFLEVEQACDMVSDIIRELKKILAPDEFNSLVGRLVQEMSQLQLYEHNVLHSHLQVREV